MIAKNPANIMTLPSQPPQQPTANPFCISATQYHENRASLQSYYAIKNSTLPTTFRKPHPLSTVQTWQPPNMERKILSKTAPPSTIVSSSTTKDALKPKPTANQKITTKAKLNAPANTNSKPDEVELLQKAAAKVTRLTSTKIPDIPHILSVPEHRTRYSLDECSHPLFTREEFSALQYMTHLEEVDRGILLVESSSVVEDKGISPASSGGKDSRTPNGEADAKRPEYKKKIKFGDYAKVGKTVTPRPNTVTVMEHKLPPKPAVVATAVNGRGYVNCL